MGATQIRGRQVKDQDITNADIADGTVRGTSANSSGTVGEIQQGTISTPDLRDASVSPAKIDSTATYAMTKLNLGDGADSASNFALGFTNGSTMGISRSTSGIRLNGGSATGALLIGNGNIQITGQILADTGTASIASLSFAGDINSGFFRPSSGQLAWTSGGTERLKFTASGIDFEKNQAQQLVVHLLASDPSTPVEGQIWYRTDIHQWFGYNGTTNVVLG